MAEEDINANPNVDEEDEEDNEAQAEEAQRILDDLNQFNDGSETPDEVEDQPDNLGDEDEENVGNTNSQSMSSIHTGSIQTEAQSMLACRRLARSRLSGPTFRRFKRIRMRNQRRFSRPLTSRSTISAKRNRNYKVPAVLRISTTTPRLRPKKPRPLKRQRHHRKKAVPAQAAKKLSLQRNLRLLQPPLPPRRRPHLPRRRHRPRRRLLKQRKQPLRQSRRLLRMRRSRRMLRTQPMQPMRH